MYLMIKAFPERDEAEMIRFQLLLNVQCMSEACHWINTTNNNRSHFISVSRNNFLGRATPTSTVSSSTIWQFPTSFTCCAGTPIWPVTLPWLCLIKYLWHHKLPFSLLLMLAKMVLMHHPVGLLRLSVFPKVGVEDKDFLAAFLFPIHHHWPGLTCLVPSGFSTLQVTFILDLSSLSCACCVCLWRSVEEVLAQAISCYSYEAQQQKSKLGDLGELQEETQTLLVECKFLLN